MKKMENENKIMNNQKLIKQQMQMRKGIKKEEKFNALICYKYNQKKKCEC